VLPIGALFAYLGQQVGRIVSVAFAWATTTLFGRVPPGKQLVLSIMALASLAWPIAVLGVLFPPVATFLYALVTPPSWLDPWLRLAMLVFAVSLPALVGAASQRLGEDGPSWKGVARGYPTAAGLFVVLVWMMVLAPVLKVRAILRRWTSAHVTMIVKQDQYDRVVGDLVGALARAGIPVRLARAGLPFEVPGRVLALLGGPRVRRLVPPRLLKLDRPDLEVVVHPMDLAVHGRKETVSRALAAITRELTFTEAYQTWDERSQCLEDELLSAARGQADVDAIGREIEDLAIDHEQWGILYRLFLQVRLRRSPIESDALIPEFDRPPPFRERLRGVGVALRRLWPRRRRPRGEPERDRRAA
jgi:hemoglobin-like flavoprotein